MSCHKRVPALSDAPADAADAPRMEPEGRSDLRRNRADTHEILRVHDVPELGFKAEHSAQASRRSAKFLQH
jgi:hypothetical protein